MSTEDTSALEAGIREIAFRQDFELKVEMARGARHAASFMQYGDRSDIEALGYAAHDKWAIT